MITIAFTHFRGLSLANLRAALFTVRQQDFDQVASILFLDNNTVDEEKVLQDILDEFNFPVPVHLISIKHGDPTKTHAWSTNFIHRATTTPWIFFTRSDYLIAPNTLALFREQIRHDNMFIIGGYYGLDITIDQCNQYDWRTYGVEMLKPFGREYAHGLVDVGGVWLTTKSAFDSVGGLDERMWAWGHQQTLFQYRLRLAGTEFVKVPQVVFYHAEHGYEAPRDHSVAAAQLKEVAGIDVAEMWQWYTGPDNPYRQ